MKTYKDSLFGGKYKIRKPGPSRTHVKHDVEYLVNPNRFHAHYDAKPAPVVTVKSVNPGSIRSLNGKPAIAPQKALPHAMVGVSLELTSIKSKPLPKMGQDTPLVITHAGAMPLNNAYSLVTDQMAHSAVTSQLELDSHGNSRPASRLQGHRPIPSHHTNKTPRTGTRSK